MDSRSGKLRARWGGDAKLSPAMAELCSLTLNRRRGPASRAAIEMSLCSVTPNLLCSNLLFLWCRPLGTTQSQLSRRSSRPRLGPPRSSKVAAGPTHLPVPGGGGGAPAHRPGHALGAGARRRPRGSHSWRGVGTASAAPGGSGSSLSRASVPPWCWSRWSQTC